VIAVDVPDDASDDEIIAAYEQIGLDREHALAVINARRNGYPAGD